MDTECRRKYALIAPVLAKLISAVVVLLAVNSTAHAQFRSNFPIIGNLGNSAFGQPFFQPNPILQPGQLAVPTSPNYSQPYQNRRSTRSPYATRGSNGAFNQPSLSSVPDMFGDFFGGRPPRGNGPPGLPPRGGAGTRSVKLAENLSPQPRTRTFFSYHFFNDVLDGSFGDVNRYSLGFELANPQRTASIDIRLPFAHTLSSEQVNGRPPFKGNELGNANIILKRVLVSNSRSLVSGGIGVAIPTADDGILRRPGDNREILRVENDAVHLLPFLGYIKEIGPRVFSQGFLQLDIDPTGNEVFSDVNAMNLRRLGVIHDPTLLFVDMGLGYRVFENRCSACCNRACIHSMSVAVEVHYATTIQDTDLLNAGGFTVGDTTPRFDVLNLTIGSNLGIGNSILRPGIVVPLRDNDDRQFDFEVFLQLNRYY